VGFQGIEQEKTSAQYNGVQGWLLLFCIAITILGPLFFSIRPYTRPLSIMSSIIHYADAARTIYGIYVGIAIWRKKPVALNHVKIFLIWTFVLANLVIARSLGNAKTMAIGVASLCSISVWWLYFKESKRVRMIFGRNL
jgi:hypothetical protein